MTWLSSKLMDNKGASLFETLLVLSILALTVSLLFQGKPLSDKRIGARINSEIFQKQLQETRFKAVQLGQDISFGFPQAILSQLCETSDIPNLVFFSDGSNSGGVICIKSQKTPTILEIDRLTGLLKTRGTR